jgi:hypothetical protein
MTVRIKLGARALVLCALAGCAPGPDAGDVTTATSALQKGAPPAAAPSRTSAAPEEENRPEQEHEPSHLRSWRKSMQKVRPPKKDGCFQASHPGNVWVEVPCDPAPTERLSPSPALVAPSVGSQPQVGLTTVGGANGPGMVAQLTGTTLSAAEGSFPIVSGLTSITDSITKRTNDYSLQMNTNQFNASRCSGALVPANCRGWVQYDYENFDPATGKAFTFIQYWIIGWGKATCPNDVAWQSRTASNGRLDCVFSTTTKTFPTQPATSLGKLTVTGSTDGTTDLVVSSDGTGNLFAVSQSSLFDLSGKWTYAEFNLYGRSSGSQAQVSNNTTLVTQIETTDIFGSPGAPSCTAVPNATVNGSTTAETNNTTITANSCCSLAGTGTIAFTESTTGGPAASVCTPTPEDNFYREKTCSLPSSAGLAASPLVSVVSGGNVWVGDGFNPGQNSVSMHWTKLGQGGSPPKSHPVSLNILDANGANNWLVMYTGADHNIYQSRKVGAACCFSPFAAAPYTGLSVYSAIAVAGNLDSTKPSFASTKMLIVALDSVHKVRAILSDGKKALTTWISAPSKTLLGAPGVYADNGGVFWVVGVDATTKVAAEIEFDPVTRTFGTWNDEPGGATFGTGASASFTRDPNDTTSDYTVSIAGNGNDKISPFSDMVDWTFFLNTNSALPGKFDSAPSPGNSVGCSAGGCGMAPVLTIHAADLNCYWRSATDPTSEWGFVGRP